MSSILIDSLQPQPDARQKALQARRRAERLQRQATLGEARRGLILEAAKAVFAEQGLGGASLREIARRAGYTAGALYSYFDSKEAIYAELLADSLGRLKAAVAAARPASSRRTTASASGPGAVTEAQRRADAHLMARSRAWFDFYAQHPRDLDLGFYLLHGLKPTGLTAQLNQQLNQRLLEALQPVEDALLAIGCPAADARREHAALFAHGVGLLVLQHTGRIRLFGQQARALFEAHLLQTIARWRGAPAGSSHAVGQSPVPGVSGQPELF